MGELMIPAIQDSEENGEKINASEDNVQTFVISNDLPAFILPKEAIIIRRNDGKTRRRLRDTIKTLMRRAIKKHRIMKEMKARVNKTEEECGPRSWASDPNEIFDVNSQYWRWPE